MSWASLLKIGTAVFGKVGTAMKSTANVTGKVASKTPAITKGAGEILHTVSKPAIYVAKNPKTAIIAPGVAYAGWKGLVDHQPVLDSAKEYGKTLLNVAVGEDGANEIGDDLDKAKGTVNDIKDTVTEGKSLLGSLNESLGGVKSFISNITGGEGLNMFSNFFKNIFSGKVSGMSFIGLLAAGMLTFGRFGWLGKIAGALLGMTMIGNNSLSVDNGHQMAENRKQAQMNVQSETRTIRR